jgi:hypothetical protein
MNESPSFDLHLAECTAQAAAIWLVLETILRQQFKGMLHEERAEFIDRLLEAAETITLPVGEDPQHCEAAEWTAHRYWQLIENFAARARGKDDFGLAPKTPG